MLQALLSHRFVCSLKVIGIAQEQCAAQEFFQSIKWLFSRALRVGQSAVHPIKSAKRFLIDLGHSTHAFWVNNWWTYDAYCAGCSEYALTRTKAFACITEVLNSAGISTCVVCLPFE
jgi:hypothetical protein